MRSRSHRASQFIVMSRSSSCLKDLDEAFFALFEWWSALLHSKRRDGNLTAAGTAVALSSAPCSSSHLNERRRVIVYIGAAARELRCGVAEGALERHRSAA